MSEPGAFLPTPFMDEREPEEPVKGTYDYSHDTRHYCAICKMPITH